MTRHPMQVEPKFSFFCSKVKLLIVKTSGHVQGGVQLLVIYYVTKS